MNHITTYTGKSFYPLTPDINHIELEDIAHALSLLCRAGGHFRHYYSVAQHCINCAIEAEARGLSTKLQLACLLHDGSEAYISDITRPVKKQLGRYLEIETNVQNLIYEKFLGCSLSDDELAIVTQVDDYLLINEFDALMEEKVFAHIPPINSNPSLEEADYLAVKNKFVRLADKLIGNKKPIVALGIDGCRNGWCVVRLDSLGNSSMHLIDVIDEDTLSKKLGMTADIVIVDIPIGLSDQKEGRKFDSEAREKLGNRRSSVFPTPCRKAIYQAKTYEEACEINLGVQKKKITQQAWAIVRKIREVDTFLQANPNSSSSFYESHPELCFLNLLGHPCKHHKRDSRGEKERVDILRKHLDIQRLIGNYSYSPTEVLRDDVIDAAVLAVTGLEHLEQGTPSWLLHN